MELMFIYQHREGNFRRSSLGKFGGGALTFAENAEGRFVWGTVGQWLGARKKPLLNSSTDRLTVLAHIGYHVLFLFHALR